MLEPNRGRRVRGVEGGSDDIAMIVGYRDAEGCCPNLMPCQSEAFCVAVLDSGLFSAEILVSLVSMFVIL